MKLRRTLIVLSLVTLVVLFIAWALGGVPYTRQELETMPDRVRQVLDDPEPAWQAAESLVDASNLIVVARGFLYGAALEKSPTGQIGAGLGQTLPTGTATSTGATDHLRLTLTLPATSPSADQGLTSTLVWTFTGTQRAGASE